MSQFSEEEPFEGTPDFGGPQANGCGNQDDGVDDDE